MADETVSLMDRGLKKLMSEKREACIHLKNGIKLAGQVLEYDTGSIRLTGKDPEFGVVIDRSAVSSLQPNLPTERRDRT